jgi:diguanylate cyclase (GGDEF)-like protein
VGTAPASASSTDGLTGVLADLVSEPQLDRVLDKVVGHARAALDGATVALVLEAASGSRCRPPCSLPDSVQQGLERWAGENAGEGGAVLLGAGIAARTLGAHPEDVPCLCIAPMHYGDRTLGLIAAIGETVHALGEPERATLEDYAEQAAIALANARLFEAQEALAKRDPLTGLLNHREFHETMSRGLAHSRHTGTSLAVVLFDLDRFKSVNDTAGHGAGDRLLRQVASALGDVCRTEDQAFRVGGDEFALVLPRTTLGGAVAAAERAARQAEAAAPRIGVSFGTAGWPDHGPTKDVVLAHADAELYEMKRSRRLRPEAPPVATPGRQRQRLAVASRLSTRLAHAQDPEEVARLCVDELHHSFDYYLAVIQRLDPDGVLRVVAGAGPLAEDMAEFLAMTQAVGDGVNGRVARTGEAALVPDTRLDPDYLRRDPRKDPGSELSVPIHVEGRVWGVLNLEQVAVGAFADDDLLLADTAAAQVGSALHRCRLVQELEGAFLTTLGVLSDAIEFKDAYTAEHTDEVADLAVAVGGGMGLGGEELRRVRHAALTHDLGKVGIRSEVLLKPGRLDPAELAEMRRHTLIGAQMLSRIPFFAEVAPLVRSSHERWDGGGYPDGLAGEEIPLGARIVAAADAFHAMTSDRPYRSAMSREDAVAEMRACAATQFDPAVVRALLEELV